VKHILCFGSLNIDRVYRVKDFVSAGETVASQEFNNYVSGKGPNQSLAARAGGDAYHAGNIDVDGVILLDTLQNADVNVSLIKKLDMLSGHAVIYDSPHLCHNIRTNGSIRKGTAHYNCL